MFESFRKEDPTSVDPLITQLVREMQTYGPDAPEYDENLKKLRKLNDIKSKKDKRSFSWDTVLVVGGHLLGVVIIVAYEQKHAWVSKAFPGHLKTQ